MWLRFTSLPRWKNDALRMTRGLLFLMIFIVVGGIAACQPAVAGAPAIQSQPFTFYLGTWSENSAENRLISLDPETLDDQPDDKTLEPGIFSADGSTGVSMEYPEGRGTLDTRDIWIVIYDLQSGVEQNRFHPPVRGIVSGLSEDGTHLLWQHYPDLSSSYPPAVEWYVLDTTNGAELAYIKDADNACFRQIGQFLDSAGQRIYCVVEPALTKANEPVSMQIVAYDVESGLRAEEVELPEVLISGATKVDLNDQSVAKFLEPAVALSPDGQRLAVVHAASDKITMLDAHSLTVEKTFFMRPSANLWDLFGFAPALTQAKVEMKGTIRQAAFSASGRYLYVFSQKLWVEPEEAPAERGLQLVDLEQESIVAGALPEYQIQWVKPAPDGTIFVFGTTEDNLGPHEIRFTSPSMLWRLDGLTLEILAERPFTGYQYGRLVNGTIGEAASMQYSNCPVTQPPETTFIPPKPWPAHPPGEGKFWFGHSGLWTALPVDGSWRQLALGEKFWWWSEEFDVAEDTTPDLTVTARNLGDKAVTFQAREATNGYHESFHWAMLMGVELTAPGCWKFTGQYKGHQLSFVLWVPAE